MFFIWYRNPTFVVLLESIVIDDVCHAYTSHEHWRACVLFLIFELTRILFVSKSSSKLSNLDVKSRPLKQSKVFDGRRAALTLHHGMTTKVYQVHMRF